MTKTPHRQRFLLRYPAQTQGFRELLAPSPLPSGKPGSGKTVGRKAASGNATSHKADSGKADSGKAVSTEVLAKQSSAGQGPQQGLLENAPALTMLWIPPGRFWMGSPAQEPVRYDDEGPLHLVQLEGFFMGQTPITQAQWREVAGWQPRDGESWGRELSLNPSRFQAGYGDKGGSARLLAGELNTDQRPVECVSWEDAIEFCNRLSQRTGRHYSLPSEAQWEYACRAGGSTPFHFGGTISSELANFYGDYTYGDGPKGEYRQQTTSVGMFPANAWGLQDMHGNVWEWCLDQWHANYEGAPLDGSAWVDADANNVDVKRDDDYADRLLRGGSWSSRPGNCRSACRLHPLPDDVLSYVGLRVVCLPQGCFS
jgi:formylglycine-generating enzyme required for sulfatase activity